MKQRSRDRLSKLPEATEQTQGWHQCLALPLKLTPTRSKQPKETGFPLKLDLEKSRPFYRKDRLRCPI